MSQDPPPRSLACFSSGGTYLPRRLASSSASCPRGPPRRSGLVLYVDLFLAHVLLYYLFVLDGVLAHPYLLLDHRALLGDDLFLGHRHRDLFLADLGLRRLPALHGHALDADLFAPLGHPYLLALGPYPLSDVDASRFALAGTGPKLLLGALNPELVCIL
jgi:hypothetical protein